MMAAQTVKRRWGRMLSRWLLLFVAVSFTHAALSLPALFLILVLMHCTTSLAAFVALLLFFPCFLLFELGVLEWEPPLEGPLEVMIPMNSLLWSLVMISLYFGILRLVINLLTLLATRSESKIPPGETNPARRIR